MRGLYEAIRPSLLVYADRFLSYEGIGIREAQDWKEAVTLHDLKAHKLRYTDCYNAGRAVEGQLPIYETYEVIAEKLNMKTRKHAQHEARVALGKLILLLKRTVNEQTLLPRES